MEKLKMLGKGPNGNYRRGQVIEVDALRASILVSGGHAAPADEAREVIDDSDAVDTQELQALPGAV